MIRLRDDDATESQVVPADTVRLNYRVDGEPLRRCVGHKPFRSGSGDYVDCRRDPEPGKRVCERCAIVEATFAANLHHAHTRASAELDPSIREHLKQPNRLYLAAFRDGTIKVGTSTATRASARLAEQGAWMARFMAETTDGVAVRQLEDAVTEVWSVPQVVSVRRKVKGMVDPVADAELDRRLAEAAVDVARLMENSPDERIEPLAPETDTGRGVPGGGPGERWRHPLADHPAVKKVLAYPPRLIDGAHDLQVVTAIGRVLLVRRPGADDVFAIDPAPLFGVALDIGDYGSAEIAIQDSLF